MKTRIMKVLAAAGSAGALTLLYLVGASGAASASPAPAQPAQPAQAAAVASLRGFQPAAASFVSPAWGVALGGSGYGHTYRAQLAVTADGGAHWSLMRAPAVWLANGSSGLPQVNQVVFADPADGWLYSQYNSGLVWVTHNGGASWREIALPGTIQTMAASGGTVYAVVQRAGGGQLYSSPVGWNAWTRVNPWTRSGPMTGSILAVSGRSVWFASSTVLWTTADGAHWASYPLRSPGTYYGAPYELAGIAAANSRVVSFLWASPSGMFHTGMKVLVSFNGGRSQWQTLTAPPPAGDVAAFATAPGRYGVMTIAVVTPGLDKLYRSANLGQSWTTYSVPGTGGGIMLNSLQFMSPTAGCLVVGNPAFGTPGSLLLTSDAGQSWYPVRF
jgi:photosystem II stability/assembly factor-like uncharacterized protein